MCDAASKLNLRQHVSAIFEGDRASWSSTVLSGNGCGEFHGMADLRGVLRGNESSGRCGLEYGQFTRRRTAGLEGRVSRIGRHNRIRPWRRESIIQSRLSITYRSL